MEVEKAGTKSNRTWHVWLTEEEQQQLIEHTQQKRGTRDRLIIEMGVHSGLRSMEIPQVRPQDIAVEQASNGDVVPTVTIYAGKDTSGEGGKRRTTILRNRDLFEVYADSESLAEANPFVGVGPRRVQQIIAEAGDSLAQTTGNSDWEKLSSHDLRRSWGHTLLVRKNMNARALMSAGGWSDYDTMVDYLHKADTGTVVDAYLAAQH